MTCVGRVAAQWIASVTVMVIALCGAAAAVCCRQDCMAMDKPRVMSKLHPSRMTVHVY